MEKTKNKQKKEIINLPFPERKESYAGTLVVMAGKKPSPPDAVLYTSGSHSTAPTLHFTLGPGCQPWWRSWQWEFVAGASRVLSSLSSPDSSHMLSNGKRQIVSQTTQLQSIQPPLQDEKLCRNGLRLQFYSCRLVQQSQRHFTAGQLSFVCLSGFKIFF